MRLIRLLVIPIHFGIRAIGSVQAICGSAAAVGALSLGLLLYPLEISAADAGTYRVLLRDKGTETFQPGSTLYRAAEAMLSPRARARRAKVSPPDSLILYADAPVYQPYVADLERSGAKVLLQLRWRNYVVVACDSATAVALRTKPYVLDVQPTSAVLHPQTAQNDLPPVLRAQESSYGTSLTQLRMLNIPPLHRLGLTGRDILVGVIDTGFRWRTHQALESARILAEYDFINSDSLTANEATDHPNQDSHGSAVLSVMAAWYPDSLIGVAPCAWYILAKTENITSERRIEEDAYAAALEWMEARGVDVVNTSLGYSVFDSTETPYSNGALDGKTTIVASAVAEASRRGVLCVVAAGNVGDAAGTVSSPGDVESALTVGAVADTLLTIPRFTSRGPTADGRLKPDLAALGVNVRTTTNAGATTFGYGSGTSLATPLISGSAALLLEAFPELTPTQIKHLLASHGSHHTVPNTAIGYGVPDILAAAVAWDILCAPPMVIPRGDSAVVALGAASTTNVEFVEAFDQPGTIRSRMVSSPPWFWTKLPADRDSVQIAFTLRDQQRSRRFPHTGYFRLSLRDTLLPCRWNAEELILASTDAGRQQQEFPRRVAIPVDEAIIPIPPGVSAQRGLVYDATGRLRAIIPLMPYTTSLRLPQLEAGTYIVAFEDGQRYVSLLVLLY